MSVPEGSLSGAEKEKSMSVVLLIVVAVVLFGLVRSTETLMEVRRARWERGVDTQAWL